MSIKEDVILFVREFYGLNEKKSLEINPMTKIQTDLNIYGDDAVDLLMEFSKKFNVVVSQFHADKFFKGEGLVFGIEDETMEFYVQDLINAVDIGELHHLNCLAFKK